MSNIVEYILELQDKMSATLTKIGANTQSTSEKITALETKTKGLSGAFSTMKGMIGAMGVAFAFSELSEGLHDSVEEAKGLNIANAQIKAGLLSTQGAAGMTYDAVQATIEKLRGASTFTKEQITDMESMLLTFPDVTSSNFDAASQAITNLSAKMHQDLKSSAVEVGKALQDPELGVMALRRIGVNFNREQSDVIKNLVKNGHKAEAQTLILTELNKEFGGAAKAAFDADPMSQYNLAAEKMKETVGGLAIKIQGALAPALIGLSNIISGSIDWMEKHKALTAGLTGAIALLTIAINMDSIALAWLKMQQIASAITMGALTVATWFLNAAGAALTVVTWLLSAALWSTGIPEIVLAVVALAAAIIWAASATEGWGKTWKNIVSYSSLLIKEFVLEFKYEWLGFQDMFMSGLETIEKGWYKVKGLWNKTGANAGLAGLEKERNQRAREIAAASDKVKAVDKQLRSMKVWEVVMKPSEKANSSIKAATIPGTNQAASSTAKNPTGKQGGKASEAIATGGTRNTQITINLGKMVENVVFNGGLKENAQDLTKQVEEIFLRVLYAAESAG